MLPDPNTVFPISGLDSITYVKPTITNPNIIVWDFTYFSDQDFEKHVTHHYDFNGDKLIIWKFCQIASWVNFVMNWANHQMNCISTYPFYIFKSRKQQAPQLSDLPLKWDTVIWNDVRIWQNSTILPWVHIWDWAIIGLNSIVWSDIPPYTIVAWNPAREIRKRFDDELIDLLEKFQWWNKSIDEIDKLIPILSCSDLNLVKAEIKRMIS